MNNTTMQTTLSTIPSVSRSAPRRLTASVALVLAAVLGLGTAAAGTASASPANHVRVVHGTFLDPGSNITNVQPSGDLYTFDVSGGTQLQGDLSGSTTYAGSGTIDIANNKVV